MDVNGVFNASPSWLDSCLNGYVDFFFHSVEVIGGDNVPQTGPIILVGNHNNQFVDGFLLRRSVYYVSKRITKFLVAEKSYNRPVIGWLAKQLHSIPVARAQDNAVPGQGSIAVTGTKVTGADTLFTKRVRVGDTLVIGKQVFRISKVVSDEELDVIYEGDDAARNVPMTSKWKLAPKMDQKNVFESVWTELKNAGSIGIFPEGGSHDRTELLPLKAGVALMALGAMQKYPGTQVKIIPCGLNYFRGHKFRSRVLVEFGEPVMCDDLLPLYEENKREAVAKLLDRVQKAMRDSLLHCADYETTKVLHLALKLYQPHGVKLDPAQYAALCHRFNIGHEKLAGTPLYEEMKAQLSTYYQELKENGVRDEQVRFLASYSVGESILLLVWRTLLVIFFFIACLPGFVFAVAAGFPVRLIAHYKAREAQKASDVKIKGLDVVASWKFLAAIVVIPMAYLGALGAGASVIFGTRVFEHWAGYQKWAVFLFFALFYPMFAYKSALLFVHARRVARSMKPLLYRLAGKHVNLAEHRERLSNQVRTLVEKLGPTVFQSFDQDRVIPKEHIISDRVGKKMTEEEKSRSLRRRHIQDEQEDPEFQLIL